jgi:hypothetical protein
MPLKQEEREKILKRDLKPEDAEGVFIQNVCIYRKALQPRRPNSTKM